MKLSGLLLLVPLASARAVRYHHQIPIIEEPVEDLTSAEQLDATPSIGVHFTTLRAIAAARYPNGTTIDLVQIPGDANYIELMSRWMTPHSTPDSPNDSITLATFFSRVHKTIETQLHHPIPHITPTVTFPLHAAQEKDFRNAFIAAKLTPPQHNPPIYPEAYATHAGLEHTPCAQQSLSQQHQHILVLAFDDSSFSASMHETSCTAATPHTRIINYVARNDLGWWSLPVYEAPRAKFWAKLQEAVVYAVSALGKPPGRIVLLGRHGLDDEFKEAVEEALWRELEVDVGVLLGGGRRRDGGNEWLAARGAAGLGLRDRGLM
jgi:hypothetical protein